MPIANTVEATIVVNFEDRFSGPSQKAFEQFKKFAAALFLAWKAFEAVKKLLLEVKLKDEATARANLLRKQLEGTFRDPIVQEIQILRRNLSGPAGTFPGAGNPALDDGLITLRRFAPFPELNLEPQFDFPSFSSGIRFVPRDMLARIHKGETVLPRSQAEQFRRRGSGGGNITFNITGGLVPDQATARKFARMLEGERRRINERQSL